MFRRALLILGVVIAGGTLGYPALSQVGGFEIKEPASRLVLTGAVSVNWSADPDPFPEAADCTGVTWYYSRRPDGEGRRRLVTRYFEDFRGGVGTAWDLKPPFAFDWQPGIDRDEGFPYLRGAKGAGPAVSQDAMEPNAVLSVLVRPRGVASEFGIGLRVQPNLSGYVLRQEGARLKLLSGGRVLKEMHLPQVMRGKWYWYELGVRTRRKKDVEIRARVLDDQRRVLACFQPCLERPQDGNLVGGGAVALYPAADFAQVYVDPWNARWIDRTENQFRCDTSNIADGEYHVVAEITDDRKAPRYVVSPFKLDIRNGRRN